MNKIAVMVAIYLSLASLNQALTQIKHWGGKVAVTSSSVDSKIAVGSKIASEPLDFTRRTGFCLGVYVEWLQTGWFTILTQAEYSQKGMGIDFTYRNIDGVDLGHETLYSRLDYLCLPILGKATFPMHSWAPYVLAGPRVDFFLGYQSDVYAPHTFFDLYRKTVLGATLGAGLQIDSLLPVGVLLEARYNLDITKSYQSDFATASNNSVDLWLGVVF